MKAGAGEDDAKRAAEEVASYDSRLSGLKGEFIGLRGDLAVVKWMLGLNLAMTVAIVGKLFLGSGH